MLTWKAFSHHLWIIIILMTLLKECPHFLSRLLHTSFLKPWNDELAFHVRVVPQIKCRVTGFISLLKHLVLFSALQERGRKHVKALTVLSTDVFLFLQLYYETYCLQKRKEVKSMTITFVKTHFHICGPESCVAGFSRLQSGTPAWSEEGWGTGHGCLWGRGLLAAVSH